MIAGHLVLETSSIHAKSIALSFRWTIAGQFKVGSDSSGLPSIFKRLVLPWNRPRDSRIEVVELILIFVPVVLRNLDEESRHN
jgi:hypothetical protein